MSATKASINNVCSNNAQSKKAESKKAESSGVKRIGIIGAMREEITPLLRLFSEYKSKNEATRDNAKSESIKEIALGGNVFYEIDYRGADIFIAYSKIGKVHAAITATTMITRFGCEKIIFGGVAGGLERDLKIGDLVLASKLCQHDVDISAFGHPLGFIPESSVFIQADSALNALAKEVAAESNLRIKELIIASGDAFIHDKDKKTWIKERFGAGAVEMEGASVAVVCHSFGVPFCVFRSISDSADGNADVSFDEFLESSAKVCAEFVKKMIDRLV